MSVQNGESENSTSPPLVKRLTQVLRLINLGMKAFVSIALVLMVSFVFLNAFLRYVFRSGLTWSEEGARYLFVWVVFLGAIVATQERGHLAVDLITSRFKGIGQRVVILFTNAVFITMLAFLAHGLWRLMELNAGVPAPVTGVPRNTMYMAGFFGSIVMIGILIVQSVSLGILGRLEQLNTQEIGAIE